MPLLSSLIIVPLFVLQSAVASDVPSTQPDDVEVLITLLGDAEWQVRQGAQDRLVLMGAPAQAALEQAARESDDPEVRTRAEAALVLIAENARIGPSIITIQGSDLPLREVIRQLSEQAGVQLEVFPPEVFEQQRDSNVTLDIDHQNFWDAMRQITEKTGLTLQQWDNSGVKLMQGGPAVEGISQVSGAFLVSAVRVARTRSVELAGGQNISDDFSVTLSARAEPRLRLLRVSYMPDLREAIDELGNSLLPPRELMQAGGFSMAVPAGAWQMTARLASPANSGQRIVRLKGTIDVSVQTRSEQLEVPDILSARSVARVAGGVRFIVKELRRNGDSWTLEILVRPEGAGPVEWERMQQILSVADLRLLDEHGEAFHRTGYSSSGGPEQVEMSIEFSARPWGRNQKIGQPAKLVWNVPTETKDLSVPFEFRDLPIP